MKLPTKINKLIASKKIYIYLAIMLLSGILILISGNTYTKPASKVNEPVKTGVNNLTSYPAYTHEEKIKNILSKVDGVGAIDIIINYSQLTDKISDSKIKSENYSSVTDFENTHNDTYSEHQKITGVVIVAQGGGDDSVVSLLRKTVSEYLDIPAHKVNVLKMK